MTNKEQRRQEWAARIENYKASGQTMAVWCSANGGNIEQLKYWLRKFKNASISEAKAASIPVRWTSLTTSDSPAFPSSSLILHVGPTRIELESGFDPDLLLSVVKTLQPLC
ncbi:IS66 family insertion sequence element accessory protein TnpA [Paenibacillus sp. N3.4]|uniref:IS66 family insertion sequence element accessory protein TnpA n=1 Tax=Paenibacillus sp. N3.4 TaxID=2603222 RepID=UPI0011CB3DFF|nr:IS66 family insertion sequence element accessory protein TnpB [Paenibacillus sp. N3.4]TXK67403.1 IS66 family insertion sequence element accessory protein TnpB [Paenibacillus sp. N3.4]